MAKRLLVSCNFSIDVLEEGMRFWAARLAWPLALGTTGHNALATDLSDPATALRTNRDGPLSGRHRRGIRSVGGDDG